MERNRAMGVLGRREHIRGTFADRKGSDPKMTEAGTKAKQKARHFRRAF